MGRDVGLHKYRRFLWIDPGSQVERCDLARSSAQGLRVLRQRDGVQVNNAKETLVIVLNLHPLLERAEIVADVEVAGRLNTGKHAREALLVIGRYGHKGSLRWTRYWAARFMAAHCNTGPHARQLNPGLGTQRRGVLWLSPGLAKSAVLV